MTKKEIANLIHTQTNLTLAQATDSLNMTFEAIVILLAQYGRVEIRGFGVFTRQTRAARRARNPRTGEEVWVEARETVVFRPSQLLKDDLTQRKEQKKAQSVKSAKSAKSVKATVKKSTATKKTAKTRRTSK